MGPLAGIKVLEIASIGPGPFCGMMLADMGAEVISIERAATPSDRTDPTQRNRRRITLNLKTPEGVAALMLLIERADVLFEGFRPGVAERLGFGPEVCLQRNPKLVYGRITGWGQDGPLAQAAGHDINYIALTGALHAIGRKGERPVPPLNLVGDFGGGGMFLAFGIVCAALEAQRSGIGQVVDAAMIDGTAALLAMTLKMQHVGISSDAVGSHLLSGSAHYYDTYETKDGKFVAIGSLEPQFYNLLIELTGVAREEFWEYRLAGEQGLGESGWEPLRAKLAHVFKTKTRDEWSAIMEGTDVCYAPVLTLSEAPHHPHNKIRNTFIEVDGIVQNAPAPRFSRSVPAQPHSAGESNAELATWLAAWGLENHAAVITAATKT